jgi:hypothetical protein
MQRRLWMLAALVTLMCVGQSIPSFAQPVCSAGPNCTNTVCQHCIVGESGGQGRCENVQFSANCYCLVVPGHPNCIVSRVCNYGECINADGSGPCKWNAPPPSKWADYQVKQRVRKS